MRFPSLVSASVAAVSLATSVLATSAASVYNTTGSVFVFNSTTTQTQFVFAVNADATTDDLYVHMAAPAGNMWIGVGFGDSMVNTMMLIAYASDNSTGVTLSPRLSTGHTEPAYDPQVSCELVWDSDLPGANSISSYGFMGNEGYMSVDAVCRNATTWAGGSLPLGAQASKTQPFIFAVGPGWTLNSDSLSAPLLRHDFYGHFTMDMQAATTQNASVPVPNAPNGNYTMLFATNATGVTKDNDAAPALHGFAMCVVFAVIFPLGSLVLTIFDKVLLHVIVQVFGWMLVMAAFGGGLYVSKQYIRSKHYDSPHQVLGILIVVLLCCQLGLGIINHRIVKKRELATGEKKRTVLGKIHLFLGPFVVFLGLVNGGLGFDFAQNNFLAKMYGVIVLAIMLLYLAIRITMRFCAKRRRELRNEMPDGAEGFQYPEFVAAPPAYGAQPQYAPAGYGQNVPMQDLYAKQQFFVQQQQVHPQQQQQQPMYQGQQYPAQRPVYEREPSSYVSHPGQPIEGRPMM